MKHFLTLFILLLTAAAAYSAQVTLAWEPSPTASVTGYEVRYSQNEATLATGEGAYIVDAGDTLTYALDGLGKGTWHFAVLAYNDTQKSDLSNTVAFTEQGVVVVENLHVKEEKPASVQINIIFGDNR